MNHQKHPGNPGHPNQQQQEPKELPPMHVPLELDGVNPNRSLNFTQGLQPNSCWMVWPNKEMVNPPIPEPQIQVMNSNDYLRIIEIARADLAMITKIKCQKTQHQQQMAARPPYTAEDLVRLKGYCEKFDMAYRSLAQLNNSGAPSPSLSMSPVSMSPRASNER